MAAYVGDCTTLGLIWQATPSPKTLVHCRFMLFCQLLGFATWGCEFDGVKVYKADTALRMAYKEVPVPPYVVWTPLTLITAALENVASLPTGAAVIFSFWQGIDRTVLPHLGALASKCPTFKMLCFVESGSSASKAKIERKVAKYGFPPMSLKWKKTGLTACGGSQFTAYLLCKKLN